MKNLLLIFFLAFAMVEASAQMQGSDAGVIKIVEASSANFYFPGSHFKRTIPSSAEYTREYRIGTIRPNLEMWSQPIYRMNTNPPKVWIATRNLARITMWPIPLNVAPASGSDAHMGVISHRDKKVYEFWSASWHNGDMYVGMQEDFDFWGNAVSSPTWARVNAAGWSTMAGMVIKEDFKDENWNNNPNFRINHALAMAIPFPILGKSSFVSPAVGGEGKGHGNANSIPVGARFALPRNLNVDNLNVHPLTREIARSMRDYGIFVNDGNDAPMWNGKYIGTFRIEGAAIRERYGVSSDSLRDRIQNEMYTIIQNHGIYRVTT